MFAHRVQVVIAEPLVGGGRVGAGEALQHHLLAGVPRHRGRPDLQLGAV